MRLSHWIGVLIIFLLLFSACSDTLTATPTPPQTSSTAAPLLNTPLPYQPGSTIHFKTLGLEDGLSQSVVNCILQDQMGFIWLGTQDGLNRFDGYSIQVFKPSPANPSSLSDAWITALFSDHTGSIWVGTYQGGINRYDPVSGRFQRYIHQVEIPSSLTGGSVQAIAEDSSGNLWVGTQGGLNRFEPATGTFTHFLNDPDNPQSLNSNNIHALLPDENGLLWVGTSRGLDHFNPITGTAEHFTRTDQSNSLSNDLVLSLSRDDKGNLWAGTANGLNRLAPGGTEFFRFLYDTENNIDNLGDSHINSIVVDVDGTIWAGTNYGLQRLLPDGVTIVPYTSQPLIPGSLSSNLVFSLAFDKEGVLWAGTWGGGVNTCNRGSENFVFFRSDPELPTSLSGDGIFAIFPEDNTHVWVGTYGGGLNLLDLSDGKATHLLPDGDDPGSLNSPFIWSVLRDGKGILWVGTSNGLDEWDEVNGVFIHHTLDAANPGSISGNMVTALYEDSQGEFWIGTFLGLDRFDRSTNAFIHYSHQQEGEQETPVSILTIFEDSSRNLWVGTNGFGLYRLDGKRKTFQHFRHDAADPGSLPNDIILDIHEDPSNNLWLATGGGGLSRYDPANGIFQSYTEENGLANNFVYCILEDADLYLWMSTNHGISKFDPRNRTFQNFSISDGLQSNEFNQNACAQAKDGSMFFGGVNGLNWFHPSQIKTPVFLPQFTLTALSIAGKPRENDTSVEATDTINLKWPENSFEFEFSALSFTSPETVQYAYRLENFDADWISAGTDRQGRYDNLPGGTYSLRFRAASRDNIWMESSRSIKVTITPPFWQRWWFIGILALFAVGMIFGGYRMRVHNMVRQRQELERQVAERTREIERLFEKTKEIAIMDERNRLARDLHDSAKQKAFAALAQLGTASGIIQHDPGAAREHIGEAENLVSDVIQELTFLIQEMYPLALQEKGLATSLREYIYEWETRSDIPVHLHIEGEQRLPLGTEQALYRIVQESLANVARHSRASQVEVSVIYKPDDVTITIADNGHGFDTSQKPNGIGLRSIQERTCSIGGRLLLESSPGKGTRIQVCVPCTMETGE